MRKSGEVQKALRSKLKIKSDAIPDKIQKGKKPKKLGDNKQNDGKDSRQIKEQEQSTEIGSDQE